jgi:hypothetical protein
MGEEAATPGQPVALARVFWIVPRQFTLENHRLPLALPQSFGKLRNSHVSLNPLSASLSRLATQKTCLLVKKLWTMRLPCGRPRKTKNKSFPRDSAYQRFQSLSSDKGFLSARALMLWGRPPSAVLRKPALSEVGAEQPETENVRKKTPVPNSVEERRFSAA